MEKIKTFVKSDKFFANSKREWFLIGALSGIVVTVVLLSIVNAVA
jgi:hypothetical protein